MAFWAVSVLLLALLSPAAGRQPATAVGAVEASEKLAPKTTPIAMVIKLLKDLTAKVEAQGKEEAANYDKYSCFCKEQADGKLYAIETSEKKIEELNAQIEALTAALEELANEISTLSQDIVALEGEIKTLDEARVEEHEKYQADNAEMVAAIDACERATEALKDSKAAMEGKAELNTKLAQVHAAASSGARKGFVVLTAEQEAALSELSRGPTDGKAYESTYHSNEVIEVLDDLKNQFTKEKNDLDTTEFENKKLYDNIRLEKSNEKKFKEMDKAEKERVESEKQAEKATAVEAEYVETRAKTADESFMAVLKNECEEKALLWDQRSRTRAEELQALATAIESLESGAAPNWSANKKLNDLQTHKKTPSFLQLRGGRSGRKADGRAKAMALLSSASERLHSSMLAMVSLRVEASQQATQGGRQEDPFVKVRQLMTDLIARLEADALAEASHKEFCDEGISKAVGERDEAVGESETVNKDKTIKSAEASQLSMDIATLSTQIAENKKGLLEATELRAAESAENAKTLSEAEAGLAAVQQAISILETFYQGAAPASMLLQTGRSGAAQLPSGLREDELRFKSTNSDRTGKTVADYAPDVFDADYHGSQEASKGIIGTLQVIEADFQRTISATEEAESQAEGSFTTFKTENEADTAAKDTEKTGKASTLTVTNENILTLESELSDSVKAHDLSLASLEALRADCIEKEETYEERVAKRNQEIEALKEAHSILEDWESQ